MKLRDDILVIGGYGEVGQRICRQLGGLFPGKVYAAGRNGEQARSFSQTTAGRVKAMQMDVTKPFDPEKMRGVKMVVMCLDQQHTDFVRQCLVQGIHYVDISAKGDFLALVEHLHDEAVAGGATAVLSTGLTPGLSNLLAAKAAAQLDQTDSIRIALMLGLGDRHGKAAVEWTLDNMIQSFKVEGKQGRQRVSGFSGGRPFDFGGELGRRKAYRFNFSDQHTLQKTLKVPQVSTRLCFDSSFSTWMAAALKKLGLLGLLRFKPFYRGAAALLTHLKFGSDGFALKIEAAGKADGQEAMVEVSLHGRVESAYTARVAGAVAAELYRSVQPTGVYHIEELFDTGILDEGINKHIINRKTAKND